jgi:Rrf2 family protein
LGKNFGKGPIFLNQIARQEDISEKYLSQIVIVLKSKGIITSVRGAHGGYELARHPEQVNLQEVVETLEGDLALVDCVTDPSECTRASGCITREIWSELSKTINATLSSYTIADLLKRARTAEDKLVNYQI